MSRKVKNIAAVYGVVLLVLAAVYFFPRPMKSAFDAPVDALYISARKSLLPIRKVRWILKDILWNVLRKTG